MSLNFRFDNSGLRTTTPAHTDATAGILFCKKLLWRSLDGQVPCRIAANHFYDPENVGKKF